MDLSRSLVIRLIQVIGISPLIMIVQVSGIVQVFCFIQIVGLIEIIGRIQVIGLIQIIGANLSNRGNPQKNFRIWATSIRSWCKP